MLDAVARIEDYTRGISRTEFENNRMMQDAVIRQLEIIGEASRQLTDSFRREHNDIPWREVIGMRNRIAHDYLNVDLDIVWGVVQNDLQDLETKIVNVLNSLT